MTEHISIRKADRSDIPTLISFQQRLAAETENLKLDTTTLNFGMNAMFDDPTRGGYYVAEKNGEVIACHMVTYEWSDWRNGTVYWLQSVYVSEQYRESGIFKHMFNSLMTTIRKDPGIIGLRLYVDKSNSRAQKVYEAMGMNGDHYTVYEWMKES
jgi:ribosomal protein S18 acetylase RimI-like enzyme